MSRLRINTLLCALPVLLTSSIVAAQNGDGGAASGNIVTAINGDSQGASGASTGLSISTGAIVAIAVVVFIVVILGILSAVLFYQAKKRQWTIRDTLRHSRRRVTTGLKSAMSPLTPSRGTFSPNPLRSQSRGAYRPSPLRKGEKNNGIGFDVDMEALNRKGKVRDLEKGEGAKVTVEQKMKRIEEQMKNKPKISSNNTNFSKPSNNQATNLRTNIDSNNAQNYRPEPSPIHPGDNSDAVSTISSVSSMSSRQGSIKQNTTTSNKSNHRPQKPSINIPKTGKKVVEQGPKTPMFNRMFGRD